MTRADDMVLPYWYPLSLDRRSISSLVVTYPPHQRAVRLTLHQ